MFATRDSSSARQGTSRTTRKAARMGASAGIGCAVAATVWAGTQLVGDPLIPGGVTAADAQTVAETVVSDHTHDGIAELVSLMGAYDTAGVTGAPIPSTGSLQTSLASPAADSLAMLHAHSTHIHALSETYGAPAVVASQAQLENVRLVERRQATDVVEFEVSFTRYQSDALNPHKSLTGAQPAGQSTAVSPQETDTQAPMQRSSTAQNDSAATAGKAAAELAPKGDAKALADGAHTSWVSRSAFRAEFNTTLGQTTKITILDDNIVAGAGT